jgi:predicted esterase
VGSFPSLLVDAEITPRINNSSSTETRSFAGICLMQWRTIAQVLDAVDARQEGASPNRASSSPCHHGGPAALPWTAALRRPPAVLEKWSAEAVESGLLWQRRSASVPAQRLRRDGRQFVAEGVVNASYDDNRSMRTSSQSAAISRRAALGVLMTAATAGRHAAALPALKADDLAQFRVELPADLHELAGKVRVARVAVATPPAFDPAQPWRVLIVNATSDPGYQSSRELMTAYRSAAAGAGWVAVAADPDTEVAQDEDTLFLRYALASVALDAVLPRWRDAGQAGLAFAGFSGGAKYSGWLAALFSTQRARVIGIYLSGVNEETVATAARQLKVLDDEYRAVPVFLQAGRSDTVATPARHREIRAELLRRGFGSVRLEFTEVGHRVDATWLRTALEWFASSEVSRR